jgi:GNAT superfamily N-acetyltransferase
MATIVRPRGAGRARRLAGCLLATGRVTAPELLAVLGLLAALAAATLGSRIAHGGFSNDDWSYLTLAQHPGPSGVVDAFHYLWFRPLMLLYWPATFGLLGSHAGAHLVLLAATCVAESLLLYAIVRALGAERLFAGAIAALTLILPLADSTRVWVCMDANVGSVALWLGGILVALAAFRRHGRGAALLHATAGLLYLSSIALYEITGAAVLATGLLFVVREGRRALVVWALQALAAVLFLALITSHTFYEPLHGHALLRHAGTVAHEAPRALADAIWAPGDPSRLGALLACLAVLLVLGTGAVRLWRGSLAEPTAQVVRRWLGFAAGAIVAAGAGWAMIVPSAYLSPMLPGQANRGNIVAGPALVVLLTAVAVVAGALVADRRPGGRAGPPGRPGAMGRAAALTALALVAVGAGYATQLHRDVRAWNRASAEQRRIVGVIAAQLGSVPAGSTILSAAAPVETAPGVPVFAAPWDLAGALTLRWHDASLRAYPIVGDWRIACGRSGLVLHNANDVFGPQEGPYGSTYVVDVARGRSLRIDGRKACGVI